MYFLGSERNIGLFEEIRDKKRIRLPKVPLCQAVWLLPSTSTAAGPVRSPRGRGEGLPVVFPARLLTNGTQTRRHTSHQDVIKSPFRIPLGTVITTPPPAKPKEALKVKHGPSEPFPGHLRPLPDPSHRSRSRLPASPTHPSPHTPGHGNSSRSAPTAARPPHLPRTGTVRKRRAAGGRPLPAAERRSGGGGTGHGAPATCPASPKPKKGKGTRRDGCPVLEIPAAAAPPAPSSPPPQPSPPAPR